MVDALEVAVPDKLVGFFLGPVFRVAVPLLKLADELILLPADLVDLVVGEGAPPFTNLPLDLLPLAFEGVPVHHNPPAGRGSRRPMSHQRDLCAIAMPRDVMQSNSW